jgi:tRNA (cmo5U34)-methyltransferase
VDLRRYALAEQPCVGPLKGQGLLDLAYRKTAHEPYEDIAGEGDFFVETFDLESYRFDCVVSVHAIHHGRHPDVYRKLCQKIYRGLKPAGCFACLDNVAGDTPELATLSYASWAETLRSEYDPESIRRIVETTIREGSPLSLREHLEILSDCGFNRTDVVWKKYIFGLYVGIKSFQQPARLYK